MMCMDDDVTKAAYAFAPHQNIPDVGSYRQLTNAAAITKPVSANTNNWYRAGQETPVTDEQDEWMRMLEEESLHEMYT